jgi:hypothetical protein
MSQPIYLLVGVPGSGKSWVCERAHDDYHVVSHDDNIGEDYTAQLMRAAESADKPILAETPFSMSRIMEPLERRGYHVRPIFVFADELLLKTIWDSRSTPPNARRGHLTRQETYKSRVHDHAAFHGDSTAVLNHLHLLAAQRNFA